LNARSEFSGIAVSELFRVTIEVHDAIVSIHATLLIVERAPSPGAFLVGI
jgi:hypothetical protein